MFWLVLEHQKVDFSKYVSGVESRIVVTPVVKKFSLGHGVTEAFLVF